MIAASQDPSSSGIASKSPLFNSTFSLSPTPPQPPQRTPPLPSASPSTFSPASIHPVKLSPTHPSAPAPKAKASAMLLPGHPESSDTNASSPASSTSPIPPHPKLSNAAT